MTKTTKVKCEGSGEVRVVTGGAVTCRRCCRRLRAGRRLGLWDAQTPPHKRKATPLDYTLGRA